MKNNITILYVEDDDLIREEATEYLSLIYNRVIEARNGEEALKLYALFKPDIIITDIEMPIINGLQMVKKIRQKDKKTPIIVVSAFMNPEYLLEAIELRLVKYILKPITHYKLDTALELAHEYLVNEERKCIVQLSKKSYFDQLNRTLVVNKEVISLTHNEMLLLRLLTKKSNNLLPYHEIKNKIWYYEDQYMDSLRSLIRSLRRKTGDVPIKNVSGMGYRLIIKQ
jgi:DNA-binding response OmpR family regulator